MSPATGAFLYTSRETLHITLCNDAAKATKKQTPLKFIISSCTATVMAPSRPAAFLTVNISRPDSLLTVALMLQCCVHLSDVCDVWPILWLNAACVLPKYHLKKQIGNSLWGIEWWRDRRHQVILEGKRRGWPHYAYRARGGDAIYC